MFPEWTLYENGTFSGKRLVHVGQFFFEDETNLVVDKVCFLEYCRAYRVGEKLDSFPFLISDSFVDAPIYRKPYQTHLWTDT